MVLSHAGLGDHRKKALLNESMNFKVPLLQERD
jgi:hypothetical protein